LEEKLVDHRIVQSGLIVTYFGLPISLMVLTESY
jgi:hypothetical protein